VSKAYCYQDTEHCSRHLGSVVEGRERVPNESEEGSGGKGRKVGKEQEGEVETSIRLEASHKVDDDSEDDLVHKRLMPTRLELTYNLNEEDG
jgi:hypothetical protein